MKRETLYEVIWQRSLCVVAKELKVSASLLRMRCREANIPTPNRGYWQRLRAGIPEPKEPLPAGRNIIINFRRQPVDPSGSMEQNDQALEGGQAVPQEMPTPKQLNQPAEKLAFELLLLEAAAQKVAVHSAMHSLLAALSEGAVIVPSGKRVAFQGWISRMHSYLRTNNPFEMVINTISTLASDDVQS